MKPIDLTNDLNPNINTSSDIEYDLLELSNTLNNGVVSTREIPRKILFTYKVTEDSISLKFSDTGKLFYGTEESTINSVDPLAFAYYCGVNVEKIGDLKKKCGIIDGSFINIQDVIILAKNEGHFLISNTRSEAQENTDNIFTNILSNEIFVDGDSIEKLKGMANSGRVKNTYDRNSSEIYYFSNSKLIPSTLISPNPSATDEMRQEDGRMLMLEYAALTAMKLHGQHVVNSAAFRANNGETYLIKQRVDATEIQSNFGPGLHEVQAQINGNLFFASVAWDKSVSRGEAINIEPQKVADLLWARVGANESNREKFLTTYLFKQLIGSVNSNGFKHGDIRSIADDGKIKRKLSPTFDMKIHLYDEDNIETTTGRKLLGLTLSKIELEDIIYYDKFIKSVSANDLPLLEKCFMNAKNIRSTMEKLIDDAFVSKQLLSREEADDFNSYMNSAIGSKSNMGFRYKLNLSAPLNSENDAAKENFIRKVNSMITEDVEDSAGLSM
jgi:hypothetical protein